MTVDPVKLVCHHGVTARPGCVTPSTASYSSLPVDGLLSFFTPPSDAIESSFWDAVGPVVHQGRPSADSAKPKQSYNAIQKSSEWLFGSCSGSLESIESNDQFIETGAKRSFVQAASVACTVRYDFYHLEQLGLLGRGSFGSVALVKCHLTGQVLALKSVSKAIIVKREMQREVKHEKLVLQHACSPFVVKLLACFNREDHLYFLMEAAMGGDLKAVYNKRKMIGSETHARFFSACIVCAFDHLHQRRIIYRDLKLENVVLDGKGYAKLCDFGMATFLKQSNADAPDGQSSISRTYTICGTPEYMAPEVITGQGYKFAADWWSLGVIIYEMLTGRTPFTARSIHEIFFKARAGIEAVKFPLVAYNWPNLVHGLCQHNPRDRLPMKGGIKALQTMPWFSQPWFDWEAHAQFQMEPPYVPSKRRAGHFRSLDRHRDGRRPKAPYQDPGDGWDQDFEDVVGPLGMGAEEPIVEGASYL